MNGPIVTSDLIVWADSIGIVHVVSLPDSHPTSETVLDGIGELQIMIGGRPRPLIFDARSLVSIDDAVRVEAVRHRPHLIEAVAVLVDRPLSMVLMSLALGLRESAVPVRLFTSAEPALDWLRKYVDEGSFQRH